MQGPRPTLAAQLGRLSTYSGSRSGQLARSALQPQDLTGLHAPPQTRQPPRWLPAPAAAHALSQGHFCEVAIPIDTRSDIFPLPPACFVWLPVDAHGGNGSKRVLFC